MTDTTSDGAEAEAPRESSGGQPDFEGDLTDMGTLKRLLERHGIFPNKGLGQHLLISRCALNAVVAAADLTPDDSVLEVGAGPGVLTRELAQRARRVVAVELDRAMRDDEVQPAVVIEVGVRRPALIAVDENSGAGA